MNQQVMEECSLGLINMLGRVFNMDRILSNVQTRRTELLNDLNPLGFISSEFLMNKVLILISLAIEYLALIISCIVAFLVSSIVVYRLGQLRNRKKPAAELMRMGALLAKEDAL